MRCLISLVNGNHVDNNLTENSVHVYYGSIVNNRPKIVLLLYLAQIFGHTKTLPYLS